MLPVPESGHDTSTLEAGPFSETLSLNDRINQDLQQRNAVSTTASTTIPNIFERASENTARHNPLDPKDLRKHGLVNGKCCDSIRRDEHGIQRIDDDCLTRVTSFIWKTKHGISDDALSEWTEFIRQPWFNPNHLPKSPTTLKKMSEQLPTLPLYTESVKVKVEKEDSKSKSDATQYTYKIKDIIERSLNNPQISDQCHFGAGFDNSGNTEAHDGALWKGGLLTSFDIQPLHLTPPQHEVVKSPVYPGGCYLTDCCDASDNIWECLVRVVNIYRRSTKKRDEIWASVQPILRNIEEVRLFGMGHLEDQFRFEDINGCRNSYLLKREYRISIDRFKTAVCVEIDRSEDNLDDVLKRLKILRSGRRLATNKDIKDRKVDGDGASTRTIRRFNPNTPRRGNNGRGKAKRGLARARASVVSRASRTIRKKHSKNDAHVSSDSDSDINSNEVVYLPIMGLSIFTHL